MYEDLTPKQSEIFKFITDFISANGYSPSIREIGAAVGLKSTSSVHAQLKRLEELGCVTNNNLKKRALTAATTSRHLDVPIVGKITAGVPILASENIDGFLPLPEQFANNKDLFILTVSGDSMINAGILDGDYIVVQKQGYAENGDIVAALIDDEATVKTFYKTADGVVLQPENPIYEPIKADEVIILGKVTGVFRML